MQIGQAGTADSEPPDVGQVGQGGEGDVPVPSGVGAALEVVCAGALEYVRDNPEMSLLHIWGADVRRGAWCRCGECGALSPQLQYMKVVNEIMKVPVEVLETYLLKPNDFAREPGAAPNFQGIQAMFDVYTDTGMIGKKLDAMQLKHPSIVAPIE